MSDHESDVNPGPDTSWHRRLIGAGIALTLVVVIGAVILVTSSSSADGATSRYCNVTKATHDAMVIPAVTIPTIGTSIDDSGSIQAAIDALDAQKAAMSAASDALERRREAAPPALKGAWEDLVSQHPVAAAGDAARIDAFVTSKCHQTADMADASQDPGSPPVSRFVPAPGAPGG
jgi:hypothetical protein